MTPFPENSLTGLTKGSILLSKMENIENSLPENITPPQADTSFFSKLKTKWPVVLSIMGSIFLLTAIIYTAYSYRKHGQEVQPTPTPTSTISPTLGQSPMLTLTPIPTQTLSPAQTLPVEDETKGWKTYIPDANGFSSKYPSDWQMEENVNYIGPVYPNYTFFFKKKVEFMPGVSLFIVPKTTPEEWVGTRNTNFEEFATVKEFNLDGAPATKISGIPGALDQEWVFVDKDGTTFIFYAAGLNDELIIFNQILSTFKFLD